MNGLHVRAVGAKEIVRPRRLIGRFWAAPQLHRQRPPENCVVTSIAARRKLWAECPKRGAFELEVQLGVPYQVSDTEWACPVGLPGLHDHLRDQHGVDSWQAMMLARRLARTLLDGFVEDGAKLFASRGGEVVNVANLFESGVF